MGGVASLVLPSSIGSFSLSLALLIDRSADLRLRNGSDGVVLLRAVGEQMLQFVLPAVFVIALAGTAAAIVQTPPRIATKRIAPDWSRVSPASGWSRIFGANGRVELAKQAVKIVGFTLLTTVFLVAAAPVISGAWSSDPIALPLLIEHLVSRYLALAAISFAVVAGADVVWSRYSWRRQLRMSTHEIKREFKESQGDPLFKARILRIARGRARASMLTNVPRATLVVANPTHFSVALRYLQDEGGAPIVVAKGQDLLALRIRALAEENNIPVVEDVALARSLYRSTEIDKPIPADFYRAIAELIIFLKKRGPSANSRLSTP